MAANPSNGIGTELGIPLSQTKAALHCLTFKHKAPKYLEQQYPYTVFSF